MAPKAGGKGNGESQQQGVGPQREREEVAGVQLGGGSEVGSQVWGLEPPARVQDLEAALVCSRIVHPHSGTLPCLPRTAARQGVPGRGPWAWVWAVGWRPQEQVGCWKRLPAAAHPGSSICPCACVLQPASEPGAAFTRRVGDSLSLGRGSRQGGRVSRFKVVLPSCQVGIPRQPALQLSGKKCYCFAAKR